MAGAKPEEILAAGELLLGATPEEAARVRKFYKIMKHKLAKVTSQDQGIRLTIESIEFNKDMDKETKKFSIAMLEYIRLAIGLERDMKEFTKKRWWQKKHSLSTEIITVKDAKKLKDGKYILKVYKHDEEKLLKAYAEFTRWLKYLPFMRQKASRDFVYEFMLAMKAAQKAHIMFWNGFPAKDVNEVLLHARMEVEKAIRKFSKSQPSVDGKMLMEATEEVMSQFGVSFDVAGDAGAMYVLIPIMVGMLTYLFVGVASGEATEGTSPLGLLCGFVAIVAYYASFIAYRKDMSGLLGIMRRSRAGAAATP